MSYESQNTCTKYKLQNEVQLARRVEPLAFIGVHLQHREHAWRWQSPDPVVIELLPAPTCNWHCLLSLISRLHAIVWRDVPCPTIRDYRLQVPPAFLHVEELARRLVVRATACVAVLSPSFVRLTHAVVLTIDFVRAAADDKE